jgi:hypothetical protein
LIKIASLFFAFFVCLQSAFCQLPKYYQCLKTDKEILIDGKLNDEAWHDAEWTDKFVDIEGESKENPYYDTRLKMLWDNRNLYLAAQMKEEHIRAFLYQRDTVIFYDNDFEVFVDPDSDGRFYAELEINAFGSEWDLLLNKPYSKKGRALNQFDIEGLKTAVHIEGSINNPDDKDKFWSVEIAIPFESLKHLHKKSIVPENKDVWRINFSRVEWPVSIVDGKYEEQKNLKKQKRIHEQNWVWSPQGKVNMHMPEKWGYLIFEDPNVSAFHYKKDEAFLKEKTQQVGEKHWIWMHDNKKFSETDWANSFVKIRDAGFDAVLLGAGPDRLTELIPIAHLHGLEVHAWMWTLNCNDKEVVKNHPEWYNVNRNGDTSYNKPAYVGYYKWLCPSNPEARAFIFRKVKLLNEVKGLEGIHLDYVRHPDVVLPVALQPKYTIIQDKEYPEYDYCYCGRCKNRFKEEYGLSVDEMDDPTQSEEWKAFRYNLIKEVVDGVKKYVGSDKKLSAAVFPTPILGRKLVMQAWDDWPLDLVFPMIYHNFYNEGIDWIGQSVKQGIDSIDFPLYAGLYIPALSAEELESAINIAIKNGAKGISVFDYRALKEEHWEILTKILKQRNE